MAGRWRLSVAWWFTSCRRHPPALGESLMESETADDTGEQRGVEGGASDGQSVPVTDGEEAGAGREIAELGVTDQAAEPAFCPPGQLGLDKLTERVSTVHIRTVGTALCGLVSGFLNVSCVFRGGSQSVRFLKSAKEPALL